MAKSKKAVVYELIGRSEVIGAPMYALLDELVAEHHADIRHARIGLAWAKAWKADKDGRLTLGKCKKASDLDRELAEYDFIILLNQNFWTSALTEDKQRAALLDHELCHAAVCVDKYGDPIEDERGRKVYRIRKHDIEEFAQIVERYGCYKRDLERFAESIRRGTQGELTLTDDKSAPRPLASVN